MPAAKLRQRAAGRRGERLGEHRSGFRRQASSHRSDRRLGRRCLHSSDDHASRRRRVTAAIGSATPYEQSVAHCVLDSQETKPDADRGVSAATPTVGVTALAPQSMPNLTLDASAATDSSTGELAGSTSVSNVSTGSMLGSQSDATGSTFAATPCLPRGHDRPARLRAGQHGNVHRDRRGDRQQRDFQVADIPSARAPTASPTSMRRSPSKDGGVGDLDGRPTASSSRNGRFPPTEAPPAHPAGDRDPANGQRPPRSPTPPIAMSSENQKAGTPRAPGRSTARSKTRGDYSQIEGFATQISVNAGRTVNFKINTASSGYTIDIYRLGLLRRQMARDWSRPCITAARTTSRTRSFNSATKTVDAGNWSVTDSWAVPHGRGLRRLLREADDRQRATSRT